MKKALVIKASRKSRHYPERFDTPIDDTLPLTFMVNRIRQSKCIDEIILNTSDDPMDQKLVEEMEALGIPAVQAPYSDSLKRLTLAAAQAKADILVKIPGNYPLVDPEAIDELVSRFMESSCRYGYNEHANGVLLGLGAEIMRTDLIHEMNEVIHDQVHRFVGTLAFRSILDDSEILRVDHVSPRPSYRTTLAVPEDNIYINKLVMGCSELTHSGISAYLDANPILVKYAQRNIEGAQEVGLEKICLFTSKLNSLQQAARNRTPDPSYPVSVELSLTNRCNLACKWCSDQGLRDRSQADMNLSIFKGLFKDLADNGTSGVVIEGGGEPTLYDDFAEVVQYGKDLGLNLGLITNGVKIPDREVLKSFEWIRFSLDAANSKQFHYCKGRDSFDAVLTYIRTAASVMEHAAITVGVGYVLTKDNENGLEDLVLTLKRIGVDYIQVRPVIDHPELMPENTNLTYLSKHAMSGFNVATHNLKENVISGNFDLPCCTHSLSTVIAADGDVYLCGRLNKHEEIKPIGNLYKESFDAIWKGKKRAHQAAMVSDPDFCRQWCPECRLTKYNILLDKLYKIKTRNFI